MFDSLFVNYDHRSREFSHNELTPKHLQKKEMIRRMCGHIWCKSSK